MWVASLKPHLSTVCTTFKSVIFKFNLARQGVFNLWPAGQMQPTELYVSHLWSSPQIRKFGGRGEVAVNKATLVAAKFPNPKPGAAGWSQVTPSSPTSPMDGWGWAMSPFPHGDGLVHIPFLHEAGLGCTLSLSPPLAGPGWSQNTPPVCLCIARWGPAVTASCWFGTISQIWPADGLGSACLAH